jgi:hypothetical protein
MPHSRYFKSKRYLPTPRGEIMSITAMMEEILDLRRGSHESDFNGYLEDFVFDLDEEHPQKLIFSQIFEEQPNLKIIVNYRFRINKEVIANQIIRYKDAFKIPKRALICPYIIYGKTVRDRDVALIMFGDSFEDYLYAKGAYYSLTDQDSIFSDNRNDVLTLSLSPEYLSVELVNKMFLEEKSIGALQRELDAKLFKSNQELAAATQKMSNELKEYVMTTIPETTNKQELIYQAILKWFLLKKMIYVQTMVDKILLRELDNDIKKLRQRAKENADSLIFVPLSEMWRM